MARPYPKEFRDDVVRVARSREDGVTIEQIAAGFGVHPITLSKWMRQADIDDGAKPGTTTSESSELREACRRMRLLEQENEVLRGGVFVAVQPAGDKALPAPERARRRWDRRGGDVPGAQARSTAVLSVVSRSDRRRRIC
ncbi:transposase [Mycobacterium intracellulare]|uniref:Transposase n=1 Tax=Mycobacterium intracellulare TaxID=1767 RepID=A0A7R7MTS5_MYCIT|nr:transposase [Mycobacterium intracellulare]PBA28868.1 hypothetical protein CKJ65_26095 [Mycobacterium intracellulare]BCO99328.1 hypothetical protein MINTM018_20980 [Mycobacterium intracellulare]